MEDNSTFIGIGHNPDGPDLPLGLGMQLAQEPKAMETFGRLSQEDKESVIAYIQACTTGADSKNRIANAIQQLKNGQKNFW